MNVPFLYFVPNKDRSITIAELGPLGLGHAFEDSMTPRDVVGSGPGGTPGVVLCDGGRIEDARRIGYFPDRQTWQPIDGSGDETTGPCWIGVANDARPTPAALVRNKPLEGHFVTMADGNNWLIPIARGYAEEEGELRWCAKLPQTLVRKEGHWGSGQVVPKCAALWELAERYATAFEQRIQSPDVQEQLEDEDDESPTVIEFDLDGLVEGALLAIATNYRIGPDEAELLGLFDTTCTGEVLNAVIDWPTRVDWCKKKLEALGGGNTGDGPPDGTGAIDPP